MPGQWANSTRSDRLPPDWHARRARTWRAAQGRCQWVTDGQRCTWTGRLNGDRGQCDHINPDAGDHQTNLQWLCPTHHAEKTTIEGTTALPRERRPPEPHPGLA